MASLLSKATIFSVGITCKVFLNSPFCGSVSVSGLEHLINALDATIDEKEASQGRSKGVITSTLYTTLWKYPIDQYTSFWYLLVANHISTYVVSLASRTIFWHQPTLILAYHTRTNTRLDDPVVWGILPTKYYLHPRKMRWSLGAADICFTNPSVSLFPLRSSSLGITCRLQFVVCFLHSLETDRFLKPFVEMEYFSLQ